MGHYPYPPETYSNVFAQLTAIVHGDPPELPEEKYSETARDWVSRCLAQAPTKRATYAELLVSVFLPRVDEVLTDLPGTSFLGAKFAANGRHVCMGTARACVCHR